MTTVANDAMESAAFEHATVQAVTEDATIVHGPQGVTSAAIAVGCWVAPEPGDRVLLSRFAGECFVLSVLARESSARQLRVGGRLTVSAGELELSGDQGVRVASAEGLRLRGHRVDVAGIDTDIRSRGLRVTGEECNVQLQRARLITRSLESLGERVVQCARTFTRRVEETETLHVGTLIQRIRENWLSRSKRTSITARSDVQIDGERIHMG